MLLDWFTVLAQVFNFLILVLLLKRFLYRPIVEAMRRREERIASDLAEAERARDEAARREEDLRLEREALDQGRERVLAEARREAKVWRERALDKARAEIEAAREAWIRGLEEEKESFSRGLKVRLVRQVLMVCEKALKDLAGGDLESRLVESFIQRLAAGEAPGRAPVLRVRTGFEPDLGLRARIEDELARIMGAERVEFETKPELGFGIEMLAGDVKTDWNLDSYLAGLEREVVSAFAEARGEAA
ncbi:MAG: ATPase [Desulfovibrionaceae bacterium]|nr:ATPase [Desulfovibrionaceae bacterium]